MSGVPSHIHVIDGKSLTYPNNNCPICSPQTQQTREVQFVPKVYRKGDTIVMQTSKGVMSTTTWWAQGNAFMHSARKMLRDASGKVQIGADKFPLWNEISIRVSVPMMRQYVTELTRLLQDASSPSGMPKRE